MKKQKIFIFTLCMALVVCLSGMVNSNASNTWADTNPASSTIYVAGEAIINTIPDSATVSLGVEENGEDATLLQTTLKEKSEAIINKLKDCGISADAIKTTNFQIYSNAYYSQKTGLVAFCTIRFETNALDKLEQTIDSAVAAGANMIGGVEFFVNDDSQIYLEALENAVKNAEEKAEKIKESLGKTVITLKFIKEMSTSVMYNMSELAKSTVNLNYLSSGLCKVCSKVQVVYEIE